MRRDFTRRVCVAGLLLVLWLPGRLARAQARRRSRGRSRRAGCAAEPAQGHARPRDASKTVLGFINAARRGNNEVLPAYLDTNLKGQAAVELARKLYVVMDSRLPARLNELSDRPEGSSDNP